MDFVGWALPTEEVTAATAWAEPTLRVLKFRIYQTAKAPRRVRDQVIPHPGHINYILNCNEPPFKKAAQFVDNPRLFKKVEMLGAPEERAAPRTVGRTQASALRSNDADWPFSTA
jgi:hypothetical protein